MQADFPASEEEHRKLHRATSQSAKCVPLHQHLAILDLEPCLQIQRPKQKDFTLPFCGKMAHLTIILLEGSGDKFLEFLWIVRQGWEFLDKTPEIKNIYQLHRWFYRDIPVDLWPLLCAITKTRIENRSYQWFCCSQNLKMNSSSTHLAQLLTCRQKETIIL